MHLVLPIRRFFVKVNTPLHYFAETDWSAQQSQGERLYLLMVPLMVTVI